MMTGKAELETATVVDKSWTPTPEIQIASSMHGPLGYTHKSLQGYRLNRTRNVIFLLDRSVGKGRGRPNYVGMLSYIFKL